ncbi:hypothetical protein [Paenibacillus sp. 37]|uniref:hypothetical protein n=1 Tax=Paenibacillus sp. 37 TaxID=2607911 RepID=UPI00122E5C17|nr:hypothetical protein [Paenibacillus sp. 37]
MLMETRIPSRFIGMYPGEFMVVGLSFKSMQERILPSGDTRFKIGDIEKPLDIIAALHLSEQHVLN